MAKGARVESLDALKHFKASLWKFQEAATVSLDDAEAEMQRMLMWLETEQTTHWNSEIRKRMEMVTRCQEAVRMKKLFKNSAGSRDSAIEEEKALATAQRKLADAQTKLSNTRGWARKLQKEILAYKGQVQRFATTVASDIPMAAEHLDRMLASLEAYLGLVAPSGEVAVADGAMGGMFGNTSEPSGPVMTRGEAGGVQQAPPAAEEKKEEKTEVEEPKPESGQNKDQQEA